jgi:hypothetical protein
VSGSGPLSPDFSPAPWEVGFFGLFHPVQLEIVEAALWIDEPLSARTLCEVLERHPLNNLSYHVQKLKRAGVFRPAGTARRRGAVEHFYTLAV